MSTVWFSRPGPGGSLVELRVLEPHHQLAAMELDGELDGELDDADLHEVRWPTGTLADLGVLLEQPDVTTPGHGGVDRLDDDREDLNGEGLNGEGLNGERAEEPLEPHGTQRPSTASMFDGLVEIRPNLVALSDDATNPVWWVQPADGPGHLATLAYALGLLEPHVRVEALDAHLAVMADLVAHERSARALDDEAWSTETYDPRCVACWAEPESHAMVLADAIAERARELVDALSQFPHRMDPTSDPAGF